MAQIKPFMAVRPVEKLAGRVAALPYDVYNRQEAKAEVEREPLSFLKIDRAETQFPDEVDTYDDRVYQKAADMLAESRRDGIYMTDQDDAYYIYRLTMDGRAQTGIVACAAVDDYLDNVIKKHENTREEKEQDRIRHVDTCDAQTGPPSITSVACSAVTPHSGSFRRIAQSRLEAPRSPTGPGWMITVRQCCHTSAGTRCFRNGQMIRSGRASRTPAGMSSVASSTPTSWPAARSAHQTR